MRIVETMQKADWPAIIIRVVGVAVLVAGVLLAAGLCTAAPQDNSVPSIFDSHSTPADSIRHLSLFVLGVTGLIFLVVFSLLSYVVVKFRSRAADTEREPARRTQSPTRLCGNLRHKNKTLRFEKEHRGCGAAAAPSGRTGLPGWPPRICH